MSDDPREDDDLRSLASRIDRDSAPITGDAVRGRVAMAPTRRASGRLVTGIAVAVVIALFAVGTAAILSGDGDSSRVQADSPQIGTSQLDGGVRGDQVVLAAGDCAATGPSPLAARSGHSAVWTGDEMIVWGGEEGRSSFADGAAYDPDTGRWRTLAPAPIAARFDHVAVWTGKEMLIWGGQDHQRGYADGAAYDPESDRWRRIAAAPAEGVPEPAFVWTGSELIASSGTRSSGGVQIGGVLAYDLSTDRWRKLAAPPQGASSPPGPSARLTSGVWTGHDAVFAMSGAPSGSGVVAYDPATDKWARLAGTGEHPVTQISAVYWDGERVLTFSFPTGYAIDPETNDVTSIAAPTDVDFRMFSGAPFWANDHAVLWSSGFLTTHDPDAGSWTRVTTGADPATFIDSESAVWTGRMILSWGGSVNTNSADATRLAEGVAYRPDSDRTPAEVCPLRQAQARDATAAASTGTATVPSSWMTHQNRAGDLTIMTPPSWSRLDSGPGGSPQERLAVANESRPVAGSNAQCPAELPEPGSAFISISEYTGTGPFTFQSAVYTERRIDSYVSARPTDFASARAMTSPFCFPRIRSERAGAATALARAPQSYEWVFRENGRLLNARAILPAHPSEADFNRATAVLNTLVVGASPGTPPAVLDPGQSPYCAAIGEFRTSGHIDSSTGAPKPESLASFERIRAAASPESQPALDTIIEWIRQGSPLPKSAEVSSAELESTQDWARRC